MAQITIDIPNDKIDEIIEVLCYRGRYQDEIKNPNFDDQLPIDPDDNPVTIPNPESRSAFAKRQVINFIKVQYREAKINTYIASIESDLNDIS